MWYHIDRGLSRLCNLHDIGVYLTKRLQIIHIKFGRGLGGGCRSEGLRHINFTANSRSTCCLPLSLSLSADLQAAPGCLFWLLLLSFPGDSDGKESACYLGDPGSIPSSGRSPGEGHGQPTPGFLPGESHGQRSLAGYSPWGHKESDMTE